MKNLADTFVEVYEVIPQRAREDLVAYVEHHQPTGGFLEAVISNDLFTACQRADDTSAAALTTIVRWLYNNAPIICWGSEDRMISWLEKGWK